MLGKTVSAERIVCVNHGTQSWKQSKTRVAGAERRYGGVLKTLLQVSNGLALSLVFILSVDTF